MSNDSSVTRSPSESQTSESKPKLRLNWVNILFLVITPIVAAVFTPIYFQTHEFTWGLAAFFVICFTISNMAITVGYHRYFSHRSYDVHPVLEFLFALVGSGSFQGSVLQWSTDHRRHHREIDTDDDPYSINKGFWYAHLFWLFVDDRHPGLNAYPKDLTKKPFIMFQHKYYPIVATIMGFFVPALVGMACGFGFWGGMLIGGFLRIVVSQHSTFLINSAAHTFGRQTYTDKHSARDSFILAVLTFGEGYHNFHHSFQADYRNGTRWYHWDPTKWFIRALAYFGMASRLKQAAKEEILKARLAMEERHMIASGACADRVTQLKSRIEDAQKKLKSMRESYRMAKAEFAARGRNWRRLARAEMRMAEMEFKTAYGQWRTFRRAVKRSPVQVAPAA